MKKQLLGLVLTAMLSISPTSVFAGGYEELTEAPVYDEVLNQISMREAEMLWKVGVKFFDCNTLEIWSRGYIPGAVFLSVNDWQKLLPKNKDETMVFYCQNRLCQASEIVAREVMKLGYTDVRQMSDGIEGWKLSGRKIEKP